jgi:glycosyltransferase involved in cell wall biosynthesis
VSYPAYSVLLRVSNIEKPEWLSVALDSMINQTVKPAEIVVVQDGELTDELHTVVDRYKNEYSKLFKVLPMSHRAGLGLALREGILACSSGFVACMDADGYSVPTRIEEEFDAIFEKKVDMVGSVVNEFVGSTDNVVECKSYPETSEQIYKLAKKRTPMSHSSVLLKKRMVLVCGNYESCYMAEDFALFINLLNMSAKGYNIQKPLVYKHFNEEFYKQRCGWAYFKAMVMFNKKFFKTGWFTYRDYVGRSIRTGIESFRHYAVKRRFMHKSYLSQKN